MHKIHKTSTFLPYWYSHCHSRSAIQCWSALCQYQQISDSTDTY